MTRPTTPAPVTDREDATSWLNVKLWSDQVALDPYDPAVVVIEVVSPDRAWRVDLIGAIISDRPHTRRDGSTCTRVYARIDDDVREQIGLNSPDAPVFPDVPLASRGVFPAMLEREARPAIVSHDVARRTGRGY